MTNLSKAVRILKETKLFSAYQRNVYHHRMMQMGSDAEFISVSTHINHLIFCSFTWAGSPEGGDFWSKIYNYTETINDEEIKIIVNNINSIISQLPTS